MHVKNFLTLGSGEAVSRVIAFGAYVYLARALGAEGYGIIAFAAGITLYLAKVADFAIEAVGTSEVAQAGAVIPRLGSAMLGARFALAVGLIVVSTMVVQFTAPEPDRTVLTLFFLTLLPVAASTKWIHMGLENTVPIGIWRVVGETVFLLLVVSFVHEVADLWRVPLALLAGRTVTDTALYLKLRRSGYRFGLRWDPATVRPMFRRSAPLMGQILMGLLLYNMDLLFLRAFRDAETVGYYAAAYTLISFLANIGMVYGMSVLPAIARHGRRSMEERDLYQTATSEVVAVTLPIAVGGVFVARGIILTGFGAGYLPSVLVLQVLVWVIPTAVLRNVPWAALIARGKTGVLFRATTVAVIVNAVLNVILINLIGLVGAAIATVVAEPFAAVLMYYYASREGLPLISLRRLWPPVVAAAVMAGSLLATDSLGLVPRLTVGVVVYITALALMGRIKLKGYLPVLRL